MEAVGEVEESLISGTVVLNQIICHSTFVDLLRYRAQHQPDKMGFSQII
jgi:hypothetical protein